MKKQTTIIIIFLIIIIAIAVWYYMLPMKESTEITLQDYYDTGDDNYFTVVKEEWKAQTFTAQHTYTLTKIELLLHKIGSPGYINVYLRATDEFGFPLQSGPNLAIGAVNSNILTDWPTNTWITINMTEYKILSGVKYAIILSVPLGEYYTDRVNWAVDYQDGEYTKGNACTSSDFGVTWSSSGMIGYDLMFRVYGREFKKIL